MAAEMRTLLDGDIQVFPRTIGAAVRLEDGSTAEAAFKQMSANLDNHDIAEDAHANQHWITSTDVEPSEPAAIDADTLRGMWPGEDGGIATIEYVKQKSAYQAAVGKGYTGTEEEFNTALAGMKDGPFLPVKGGALTGALSVPYMVNNGKGTDDPKFAAIAFETYLDGGAIKLYCGGDGGGDSALTASHGRIDLFNTRIFSNRTPEAAAELVTKKYVDGIVGNVEAALAAI